MGAAGTGKSALLAETAARARTLGMEVLTGRGRRSESDLAFSAVMSFVYLREWAPELDPLPLPGDAIAARDHLLADAQWRPGHFTEPPESLLSAISEVVARLAAARPLLIVVDDVQWFDQGSVEALRHALERVAGQPVAILAATRPRDVAAEIAPLPVAQALTLSPLTGEAVAIVVRRELEADDAFCAACAREAAGDLHHLQEILAAARRTGLSGADTDVEALELHAAQLLQTRITASLADVGDEALDLARAVAVLGSDAAPARASALAALEPERLGAARRELVDAGLLQTGPLAFAHHRAAASVAAALSPSERAERHLAAARLLAPDAPVAAAHHLLHAPLRGDPALVEQLRRAAAQRLADGAPVDAEAFLRRALAEPPAADQLGAVTAELGEAEARLGARQAARRLTHALELTEEPGARADIAVALARFCVARGEFHRAAAVLRATAIELGPAAPALADRLEATRITVGHLGSDLVASARDLLGEVRDDQGQRLVALGAALHGALSSRPRPDVLALAMRAWGDGLLLTEQTADSWTLSILTTVLWWCDELEHGVEIASRTLEAARSRGSVFGEASAAACRSMHLYSLGRLAEARADLEVVHRAEERGWRQILPTARGTALQVAIEQGRLDDAQRHAELPLVDWTGTLAAGPWLDARARLHLAAGRAEEALADAHAAERSFREFTGTENSGLVTWRCTAALALLALGRRDEGIVLAERELEIASGSDSGRALGIAQRTLGVLLPGAAGIASLEAAVATLRDSQARLEFARASFELGARLRRSGRRSDARVPLREALAVAVAGGIDGLADRIRLELGATGEAGVDAPGLLTASELRVARLAAQGLTNREIATTLHVTPQAINFHLGNTYRKLGVRRDGLAAALGTAE